MIAGMTAVLPVKTGSAGGLTWPVCQGCVRGSGAACTRLHGLPNKAARRRRPLRRARARRGHAATTVDRAASELVLAAVAPGQLLACPHSLDYSQQAAYEGTAPYRCAGHSSNSSNSSDSSQQQQQQW